MRSVYLCIVTETHERRLDWKTSSAVVELNDTGNARKEIARSMKLDLRAESQLHRLSE